MDVLWMLIGCLIIPWIVVASAIVFSDKQYKYNLNLDPTDYME